MRLSYFIYSTYQNTGNKVVFEHANRLQQRGHDVQIVTILGDYPRWFNLKVPVRKIYNALALSKNDTAVATFWPTAYLVFLTRARKKFYFILGREQEFYTNPVLRAAVILTLRLPLRKFTISNYLKKHVQAHTGKKIPVKIIKFFALDRSIFQPAKGTRTKLRNKIRVLSVLSWYNRYKGPDRLVKIIEKLRTKFPGKYEFTLVSLQKRPYRPVFDRFYSKVSNKKLAQLYQQADVLLAPGRFETYYVPGLEAMACGCPVIATSPDGITEYAANRKNAVILERLEDVWEKDVIQKTVRNKKLRTSLVKNGLKTAREYRWSNIIDVFEKMFFYT